jgi:hypothetical protein
VIGIMKSQIVVVAFSECGENIRIMSARKATNGSQREPENIVRSAGAAVKSAGSGQSGRARQSVQRTGGIHTVKKI